MRHDIMGSSGSTHTKGELVGGGLLCRNYSPESNDEGDNIIQLGMMVRVV